MKLLLFFVLFTVRLAAADELVFSESDREDLLQAASHARMLTTKGEIPQEVIRACREETRDFALANPGDAFQWSDAIVTGPGALPRRRLVWAARVGNFCVLHYEKGGFTPSHVLVVTSIVKSEVEARILWSEYTKKMSFDHFVSALKLRQLKQGTARL